MASCHLFYLIVYITSFLSCFPLGSVAFYQILCIHDTINNAPEQLLITHYFLPTLHDFVLLGRRRYEIVLNEAIVYGNIYNIQSKVACLHGPIQSL